MFAFEMIPNYLVIFFKGFTYLFMKGTERERQRHRQREKQVPRREPNAGLDPGSRDHTLSRRQTLNP